MAFMAGGGEMGALMRAHDWSATPLGPQSAWPHSLRTAVRLLLAAKHPMRIFWGAEGIGLYNDAYGHMVGPERHPGGLGRPARVVWDEIWDVIGSDIEHVMAGLGAIWHENRLVSLTRHSQLQDAYFTYSYCPIEDDDAPNGVGGVLLICTETTQQMVAEQRLAAQAERQRRLFMQAPGFTCILNGPSHVYEFVNESYVRLAGNRNYIGRTVREVVPDIEGQGFFELLDNVYATGERVVAADVPLRLQRMPGVAEEERFLDFVYEPIIDEAGQVTGIFVEGSDMTDAHLAKHALLDNERELRDLNAVLERRVDELARTRETLHQSQKMEAMGQLTGGIAHDFNNLLTPIIGGLDVLVSRGVGSTLEQRLMAVALRSAERAKTLVQRLLAFARRQPLQSSAVDVAGLLAGMADLIDRTLGPQIKVLIEVEPALPAATADANQLEMAILNLSVNARDAMPDGGVLTIAAAVETVGEGHRSGLPPDMYVRLSVADTGAGMDEATLTRATEPFFSTKGIGKGTGLGLSMVHGLALQLGGGIAIVSQPGGGTTVDIWLPQSGAPAAVTDVDRAPASAAEGIGAVLLVDDEEAVRTTTAFLLGDLGYEVVEATSAEAALRLLDDGRRVDLIVTDHLMPGLTGVDLARAAQARRPGLPVLIVSGYAEIGGIAPDLSRLVKPFRKDELAAAIASLAAAQQSPG